MVWNVDWWCHLLDCFTYSAWPHFTDHCFSLSLMCPHSWSSPSLMVTAFNKGQSPSSVPQPQQFWANQLSTTGSKLRQTTCSLYILCKDHTENTAPKFLLLLHAWMLPCNDHGLQSLLSNGWCIVTFLAVVSILQVYISQYVRRLVLRMQALCYVVLSS